MRSSRLTIDHAHEFALTLSASVTPGHPGCTSGPPDNWSEPEGPDVGDARVVLTPAQLARVDKLLLARRNESIDTETLVTEILRALDPEVTDADSIYEAFARECDAQHERSRS